MTVIDPANDDPDRPTLAEVQDAMEGLIATAGLMLRHENPLITPTGMCAEVFRWVGKALDDVVMPDAVRTGLLLAFEGRHEKAMNFIDIGKARDALTQIARARKAHEARRTGIILPPGAA